MQYLLVVEAYTPSASYLIRRESAAEAFMAYAETVGNSHHYRSVTLLEIAYSGMCRVVHFTAPQDDLIPAGG